MPGLVLSEERLREAAEPEQRVEVRFGGLRIELAQRGRVRPEVAISVGVRVAAPVVEVEPGRPRDDDAPEGLLRVVDPLGQVASAGVLVHFVEDEERERQGGLPHLPQLADEGHLRGRQRRRNRPGAAEL